MLVFWKDRSNKSIFDIYLEPIFLESNGEGDRIFFFNLSVALMLYFYEGEGESFLYAEVSKTDYFLGPKPKFALESTSILAIDIFLERL